MEQPHIQLDRKHFWALCLTLSGDISVLVVSFAIFAGLAATPLVSVPWVLMDSAYDGKAEKATLAFILSSTFGGLSGAILGGLIASQTAFLDRRCCDSALFAHLCPARNADHPAGCVNSICPVLSAGDSPVGTPSRF